MSFENKGVLKGNCRSVYHSVKHEVFQRTTSTSYCYFTVQSIGSSLSAGAPLVKGYTPHPFLRTVLALPVSN